MEEDTERAGKWPGPVGPLTAMGVQQSLQLGMHSPPHPTGDSRGSPARERHQRSAGYPSSRERLVNTPGVTTHKCEPKQEVGKTVKKT